MTTAKPPRCDRQIRRSYTSTAWRTLCTGRKPALPQLEGIIPEAPVHPLVHANLMAFVSAVPAAQFGPSEFRSALNDAEWLKDRISGTREGS